MFKSFENHKPKEESISLAIKEAENYKIRTEDMDKDGNFLVYPDGPKSNLENETHWKMVRTDSFKNWFGDWQNDPEKASQVVDENGEPLLVYHSSYETFDEFDPSKSQHFLTLGKGSYFAPDPSLSETYGDRVYSCFLNVKKNIYKENQFSDVINSLRNMYYSLVRPKEAGFIESHDTNEPDERKLFGEIGQICMLHKEDIGIIPSDIEHPMEKYRKKIDTHFKQSL